MEEKILQKKKNGMAMLALFILLYILAILAIIYGGIISGNPYAENVPGIILIVSGLIYTAAGWIPFLGL